MRDEGRTAGDTIITDFPIRNRGPDDLADLLD